MMQMRQKGRGQPGILRLTLGSGFRIFFLLAGIFAVASMIAWMTWMGIHAMSGMIPEPTIAVAPHYWHGHELIFGYSCAVLAGFLTTAVPNWTGRPAPEPATITSLAAFWLAGRCAVWFSALLPAAAVAAVDMAFLLGLAAWTGTALRQDPKPRNLIFFFLIVALAVANGLVHLDWMGVLDETAAQGLRLGIALIAVMITVIGGRIVPAFTRNALMRAGQTDSLPEMWLAVDRLAILTTVLYALCAGFNAEPLLTGGIALCAAVLNGLRFWRWRWQATLKDPIVWSLHLGFALLIGGFATLAATHLIGFPDEIAAQHFIGIGAIGVMTLAVMSRAALGHTGRPLRVSHAIAAAYILIAVAAVLRTFGTSLFPDAYYTVIFTSGALWIGGFALFSAVYTPILTGPRAGTPQ